MGKAFTIGVLLIIIGTSLWFWQSGSSIITITATPAPRPTPLAKYSIEALRNRNYEVSEIKLERKLKEEDQFTSYIFSFTTEDKTVTGQANLPLRLRQIPDGTRLGSGQAKFPVVIMLRGYADKEIYFTGLGTRKAAGVFAENGFITLAPDFLGFGGSDWESADILEARFERPVTVLNLLASVKTLPQADSENIFLWGHSNGGQIALFVLEILERQIPTTLWAPVTRPFPESITDYIGELDDQGKMVIASISAFLKDYDPAGFSVTSYFVNIQAPLQIHQGLADYLVKEETTDEFVNKMQSLGKDITYHKYLRNDHNFARDWDTVVARDLEFFKKHLK